MKTPGIPSKILAGRYWVGEPESESRQHYATQRINDYRRVRTAIGLPLTFSELLGAFRNLGRQYDEGARLRDDVEDAA